jgi:hypothetical protein
MPTKPSEEQPPGQLLLPVYPHELRLYPNPVICTAAIPQTATNGVSEASCQAPRGITGDYSTPPNATVT